MKTKAILSSLALLSLFSLGFIAIGYGAGNDHLEAKSPDSNYLLPLNKNHAIGASDIGVRHAATIPTLQGNDIIFHYYNITASEGNFCCFTNGSNFYNETPISGINKISWNIESFEAGKESYLTVYFGYLTNGEVTFNNEYRIDTLTGNAPPMYDQSANYIKIVGLAKVVVTSLIISYSCNEAPITMMGHYPQAVLKDTSIIEHFDNDYPKEPGKKYFTYKDIAYVKAVADSANAGQTFEMTSTKIEAGKAYYFEVAPILWRKLESDSELGDLYISSSILFGHVFSTPGKDSRTINNSSGEEISIYSNNYEYSNLRAWLNGIDGTSYDEPKYTYRSYDNFQDSGFLPMAFNNDEAKVLNTTALDNSAALTKYPSDSTYASNDTSDKIFALSYKEINDIKTAAGSNNPFPTSLSDYALALGASKSMVSRSPDEIKTESPTLSSLNTTGTFGTLYGRDSICGYVPAMRLLPGYSLTGYTDV